MKQAAKQIGGRDTLYATTDKQKDVGLFFGMFGQ